MASWDKEAVDLINEGHFRISEPGPLHAPIHGLSLNRNDDLALILETEAAANASSSHVQHASGTMLLNIEQVKLVNIVGIEAVLKGVQSFHVRTSGGSPLREVLKESSRVHQLTLTLDDPTSAAYSIEWIENLPMSPFIWPDSIETKTETVVTRTIALSDNGLTLSDSSSRNSFSRNAMKLTLAGHTLYICALSKDAPDKVKRGCLIYIGTPDDLMRKKIRCALSFALGLYLVELGHTVYDQDWHILAATSRSAYSLAKRTFDPLPMPLAHLSSRNFQRDLGRAQLKRMVDAFVANYEKFDLGNLSWAYWHAGTATAHIAPAHFGAAIEALQDAYCKNNPDSGRTKILPAAEWKELKGKIDCVIDAAEANQDDRATLKQKLSEVNKLPQRQILKSVLDAVGIKLANDESEAWKRRNDAAHGTPIAEGQELAAIRDMKLLRGLFNRMLLRMANAADNYVDYASPGHPVRRLDEPVPSA